MRLLHVYKDYYPVLGGIENHVKLLAEGQATQGHDVTVLVTSRGSRTSVETSNGVRIIRAARQATIASTPLSLQLPFRLWRERPDITHLHFPYPPGEVAQWALGRSHHTIIGYHSDIVRQRTLLRFYRPLMHRVLASADCILAASPNYVQSSETLRRFEEKCCVIPYGIDRSRFARQDERAHRLRQLFGPGPLVLFVGVLRYYKGLSYLLDAMPDISARFLIVGDGPMAGELRAQVESLGLRDKVRFAGRVDDEDLPLYYQAADLFILPACERSEAFGLVQVEAMSSGLPVVSTELGTGTSYVNQHDVSGLVVPPRDARALAQAINTILLNHPLRERLSQGAFQRSAMFDVGRMLEAMAATYAEVMGLHSVR